MNHQFVDLVGVLCAPPGAGWGASTAGYAPLAAGLHERLYNTDNVERVRERWLTDLRANGARVAVLGVPYDGGTYGLTGAAAGPLGIRLAAARQHTPQPWADLGDVRFLPGPPTDDLWSPSAVSSVRQARYGDQRVELPVSVLSSASRVISESTSAGLRIVTLGGDHSVSASALTAVGGSGFGLIHIDAHDDLSTGRDGLSLLHNSWIYVADQAIQLGCVIQIGVVEEADVPGWVRSRVRRIPTDVFQSDPTGAAERVGQDLTNAGCAGAYLSIDIDSIDVNYAPATGLPGHHGLELDSVLEFVGALPEALSGLFLAGGDITEVAPPLGTIRDWSLEPTCVSAALLLVAMTDTLLQASG